MVYTMENRENVIRADLVKNLLQQILDSGTNTHKIPFRTDEIISGIIVFIKYVCKINKAYFKYQDTEGTIEITDSICRISIGLIFEITGWYYPLWPVDDYDPFKITIKDATDYVLNDPSSTSIDASIRIITIALCSVLAAQLHIDEKILCSTFMADGIFNTVQKKRKENKNERH